LTDLTLFVFGIKSHQ